MNELKDATRQEMMIQQQLIDRGIRDELVIAAFRRVPRDRFFPEGSKHEAFADRAAPIGHGQTISQPYITALMTQRLDLQKDHKVLEVGIGSGYHTAILAQLAGEVFTIDLVKPLLDEAWERLMGLGIRNVRFRHGDGAVGWEDSAPFDRILIAAGAPVLPEAMLMSQLADGGIAVLPVGTLEKQMLIEVRRQGDQLISTDICSCRFVKLLGQAGWTE
jgi:protein-L-isoaspartate(D-aspartate) O-methyltransferase